MPLLLLLVSLPLIEIALFVTVGGAIGLWPTLALVIASSIAGLAVMRGQSANALARLQAGMEAGEDPSGPIALGALRMIAGVFLFIPGFFSSACGLLLLIPAVRRWLLKRGAARMTVRATTFGRPGAPARHSQRPNREAIDADYEVIEEEREDKPQPGNGSGWTRGH